VYGMLKHLTCPLSREKRTSEKAIEANKQRDYKVGTMLEVDRE
jgi:hypothetical protein